MAFKEAAVPTRLAAFASVLILLACSGASASPPDREIVLQSFKGLNGIMPGSGIVLDGRGNLYGTTFTGGRNDQGEVFQVSPPPPGTSRWRLKVLYAFNHAFDGTDGENPAAAPTLGAAGDLYGTTQYGGVNNTGSVFMLSPGSAGATPAEAKTLYSFPGVYGTVEGYEPTSSVTIDAAGNIYGTVTNVEGSSGSVYELSPTPNGSTPWPVTILHAFSLPGDGAYPSGPVILDATGNLYGETNGGGPYNEGTVFELSPPKGGATAWTETILSTSAAHPTGGLVFDKPGNLFGTDNSAVFELSPPASGAGPWTYTVLHSFDGGVDGENPQFGVTFDAAGNLYGVTSAGGVTNNGVAFELSPVGAQWNETILTDFASPLAIGGRDPSGALQIDASGNVYGTTPIGGRSSCATTSGTLIGCGTVYQLTH